MSFNLMSWLVGTSERYSLIPTNNAISSSSNSSSSNSVWINSTTTISQSYLINENGINIIFEDTTLSKQNNNFIPLSSSSSSSKYNNDNNINVDNKNVKNSLSNVWKSGVKLLECRYLKESGCKSACIHLCKGPTQQFFRDELGKLYYYCLCNYNYIYYFIGIINKDIIIICNIIIYNIIFIQHYHQ